jgi:hypothetical protein
MLLMLGSTEANRSKAMSGPRPKSPVLFHEALDDTIHDHTEKLDKLRGVDFGPKSAVAEGALEVHSALGLAVDARRHTNSLP